MKRFFIFLTLFFAFEITGQITDDFSDHDLTLNPTWQGTLGNFITNTNGQLQTNMTVAGFSQIALQHNLDFIGTKEWRCKIKTTFSSSGSNYNRFFLTASSPDLSTNPDGYFIQLGEAGTTDAIRLKKMVGGISSEICAGPAGSIATSYSISLKILRAQTGDFQIWVDQTGGENFTMIASGIDLNNLFGPYSGWYCKYTASNGKKFFLDDVYIGPKIVDLIPPKLTQIQIITNQQLRLTFNDLLDSTLAVQTPNYLINPSIIIDSIQFDPILQNQSTLFLNTPLVNGTTYTLHLENIADTLGNVMLPIDTNFTYLYSENVQLNDILITEIFADPSPSVGLKEVEYIEIYNNSNKYFNTKKWKLSDGATTGSISEFWINPHSYAILCPSNGLDSFALIPNIVTSFPSLNNTGDTIRIMDSTLLVINEIVYKDTWYKDAVKADGGYSLERIFLNDPCSDEDNWKASVASLGGTPGTINSVNEAIDTLKPNLVSVNIVSNQSIVLIFDEAVQVSSLSNLQINPTLGSFAWSPNSFAEKVIQINFSTALDSGKNYQLTLTNLSDCWGNIANCFTTFSLPFEAQPGDLIINELLFNPYTNGSDWIEIYNKTDKLIKLEGLILANWKDSIANKKIIQSTKIIGPKSFLVFGLDSSFTKLNYPNAVSGCFVDFNLPSLNNDSSTLFLLKQNQILDKVSYSEDWHFSLLNDVDGVSLERISYTSPSNEASNWHSASETIGFGTPGRENSQMSNGQGNGKLWFTDELITPNNDGSKDFLQINYEMGEPGIIANVKIFDDEGRERVQLLKNELLGSKGVYNWDGLDSNHQKPEIGIYILVFEGIQQNGKILKLKRTFVIGN